jgi:hypothetical protein
VQVGLIQATPLVFGSGLCRFHFDLHQITKPPESANHENSLPTWEKAPCHTMLAFLTPLLLDSV